MIGPRAAQARPAPRATSPPTHRSTGAAPSPRKVGEVQAECESMTAQVAATQVLAEHTEAQAAAAAKSLQAQQQRD